MVNELNFRQFVGKREDGTTADFNGEWTSHVSVLHREG